MLEEPKRFNRKFLAPENEQGTPEQEPTTVEDMAEEVRQLADRDTDRAAKRYVELRDRLPNDQAERLKEAMKELGWDIRDKGPEEETESTELGEPVELIGHRNAADFRREFGEPAWKVNGISVWKMPDGDACMPGKPDDPRGLRIGKNGIIEVKGKWFSFNGNGFDPVDSIEEYRKNKLVSPPVPSSTPEASREARRARAPESLSSAYENTVDRDAMDVGIPAVGSLDEYGVVDESTLDRSEPPQLKNISVAHRIFSDMYYDDDRPLAEAYREAVTNLSATNRTAFDEDLQHTDIPSALLTAVINEELRRNPSPQGRVRPQRKEQNEKQRPSDRKQERKPAQQQASREQRGQVRNKGQQKRGSGPDRNTS